MTESRQGPMDIQGWPALLNRTQAAAYCGMSVSDFDKCVKRRLLPSPVKLPVRRQLWSRAAIDTQVSKQSGAKIEDDFEARKRAWIRDREASESR